MSGPILITWDDSNRGLGFLDGRFCTCCGCYKIHNLTVHHKHFTMSIIPFYISNKYYSVCTNCGYIQNIDKKSAKKLNKANVKYFKKKVELDDFFERIAKLCEEYNVLDETFEIVESKKQEVIKEIYLEYSIKHNNRYDYQFYEGVVESIISNVCDKAESAKILLQNIKKSETLELNNSEKKLPNNSVVDRIREIKLLYDEGLISEEEYNKKKQDIMSEI